MEANTVRLPYFSSVVFTLISLFLGLAESRLPLRGVQLLVLSIVECYKKSTADINDCSDKILS